MTSTQQGKWKLEGYDTFDEEYYPLPGEYNDRVAVENAARTHLEELERTQPTSSSGGQAGIQDQVFIVDPSGRKRRFRPMG